MKTSTKYSVSDAATLYKKSRATLYKDIKNGVLSRDHDGSIDFSELLRVYGSLLVETTQNVLIRLQYKIKIHLNTLIKQW
jgi:hypothetical protein